MTIRTDLRPGDLTFIMSSHHEWYWPQLGYGVAFESIIAGALAESYAGTANSRTRWWLVDDAAGRPRGSLLLLDRGERAQLRFFYLSPAVRGRGMGKSLLRLFVDHLLSQGFSGAYLWTTAEQQVACRLYEAHGFTITERHKTDTFGVIQEELKYELTVS